MGKVVILEDGTTRNPITKMGARAGICWGADTSINEKNYKRGLDCLKSNHGRVLEFVDVEMVLYGYSARVIREWYTHIGGAPTRLQESTRYVDESNFKIVIPTSIKNKAPDAIDRVIETTKVAIKNMEDAGVPREDIANILPLGMETTIVDKRNLRNLIDMSRNRECSRALLEFRQMFDDIKDALRSISPEWEYIVDNYFKPKCEVLGYCPETRGCGRKPKLESVK